MKLIQRVDCLFDIYLKRRFWFVVILLGFWLWQNIWQSLFFVQLIDIHDYSSLFEFMDHMDGYSSSFLVRIALSFISSNGSVLKALSSISILEWICIGLSFVLLLDVPPKKWALTWILYCGLITVSLVCVIMGLKSSSLDQVITLLNVMAYACITMEICLVFILLANVVQKILGFSELCVK